MKRTIITKTLIIVSLSDLFLFLEQQGALVNFLNNLHKDVCKEEEFCELFTEKSKPQGWIAKAFGWVNTRQGHNYWSDINQKWLDCLYGDLPQDEVTILYK